MTPANLAGKHILCVEDEALVAMLIEDILFAMECIVVGPFAKASDALAALEREQVDAAILDVNLRGERSYQLADELVTRGIPFIFATGYGTHGLDSDYRHHPVVQKPFHQACIETALGEVLAQL